MPKSVLVASFAVIIGGIVLVSVAFTLASGAGVLKVARNAMCPAITDWNSIDNGLAHSWWAWWDCALIFNMIGVAVVVVGPGVGKGLIDDAAHIVGSNARVG